MLLIFCIQRHGAFVWDQFSKDHAERLLNYYTNPVPCDNTTNCDNSNNNNFLKSQGDSCQGENVEYSKDCSSAKQNTTILPPIST